MIQISGRTCGINLDFQVKPGNDDGDMHHHHPNIPCRYQRGAGVAW